MTNVYYSPEHFGLQVVTELNLSEPSYSFDLLVVWQGLTSGYFYFATDSGCSCPAPFENTDLDDLREFSWSAIEDEISDGSGVQATEAADFRARLKEAGA